jgi:sortase A
MQAHSTTGPLHGIAQRIRSRCKAVVARRKPGQPAWYDLRPTEFSIRGLLPLALVLIGCALLLYVGSQYFAMHSEQAALEQAWARQQTTPAQPNRQAVAEPALTRITIPKINLDAVVTEGTSGKALRAGPGHLRQSALPGQPGNAVIVAHRDTFFRHVYELQKGDEVQIRRGGQTYKYIVTGKRIVQPTDLSVLKQTDTPQLTLITCYPIYYIGPAPQRLIVFARMAEPPTPALAPAAAASAPYLPQSKAQ